MISSQQLANKAQEVVRLQTAIADSKALLVVQRVKGFNTEMLKDFLKQMETDLRTALEENEHVATPEHPSKKELRYFFERYGQFGAFVPQTVLATRFDPTTAAEATAKHLLNAQRIENQRMYSAELATLLALKDRFAFAIECCRRPRDQFVRTVFIGNDGAVERAEKWEDVQAICKRYRSSAGN